MRRGTTPTLTFGVPRDFREAESVFVTIKQHGKVVVDISKEEMNITENEISCTLTQKQTLALDCNNRCKIQVRVKLHGVALASNVVFADVCEILKDGEI